MIPEDAVQLPKTAKFVWLIHDVIWFLFTFIGLATVYILFFTIEKGYLYKYCFSLHVNSCVDTAYSYGVD